MRCSSFIDIVTIVKCCKRQRCSALLSRLISTDLDHLSPVKYSPLRYWIRQSGSAGRRQTRASRRRAGKLESWKGFSFHMCVRICKPAIQKRFTSTVQWKDELRKILLLLSLLYSVPHLQYLFLYFCVICVPIL